jgi:hypothetical protein
MAFMAEGSGVIYTFIHSHHWMPLNRYAFEGMHHMFKAGKRHHSAPDKTENDNHNDMPQNEKQLIQIMMYVDLCTNTK